MKKTTNINQERSEKYRYLEKLNYVPKLIIISACSVFLAGVALILSVLSMYNSTAANAKVDYELTATRAELTESKNRTSLYIVYVQELQSDLITNGFQPPPLPEE